MTTLIFKPSATTTGGRIAMKIARKVRKYNLLPIYRDDGQPCQAGDIVAGCTVRLRYNENAKVFEVASVRKPRKRKVAKP